MSETKYFKTIERISKNKEAFDWKDIPTEWIDKLELPFMEEESDLKDCFYFIYDDNKLGVAAGSYYSRFYYDEDKFNKSREYFISLFLQTQNGKIRGIKVVTADEYLEYKNKENYFSVISPQNIIKEIYETAKEKALNFDTILDGFLEEED